MLLLSLLVVTGTALTIAMFAKKTMLLGFPSGIFWAIAGGQAYTLSTAIWDVYYFVFIACLLGMTIFSILAAYSLREKRDTIADEEMEQSEEEYIDEETPATKRLHDRADKRREKISGGD